MITAYKNFAAWLTAALGIESDRGASMVEYALLVALIAVVAIIGVTALGNRVNSTFSRVSTSLPG